MKQTATVPTMIAPPILANEAGAGLPQFGQVGAAELISLPQSLHLMSAMIVLPHNLSRHYDIKRQEG
jgi:hypothetical protein